MADEARCRVIACASNWDATFPTVAPYEIRRMITGIYTYFPSRKGRWSEGLVKFHQYDINGVKYGFCDDCIKQAYLNKLALLGRNDN